MYRPLLRRSPLAIVAATLLMQFPVYAAQQDEIEYLLGVLDETDCRFIRNEITYSREDFLGHLRSKMDRNEELINSAEDFIEKIATRSAVSEIPYVALCNGELKITKDWFTELLASYRASN